MQIRVLLFGVLKDLAGSGSEEVTLPDTATVSDLMDLYEKRLAGAGQVLRSIAVSVNQEYSYPDTRLQSGDEVGLLPPVSGGSPDILPPFIYLTRDVIDTDAVLQELKQPQDGAVVVFEGIVRNHTRGRRTLFLEYEAYDEMALKQLMGIARQAREQFEIREVALVHRLGKLEIGETSVLIVIASAHRAAAFEACRWLIDTLNKTVPIWKKEHFADVAVWAAGEPFPEQLAAGTISKGLASN